MARYVMTPRVRYTTPRRCLVLAILFLVPTPFVTVDLWGSTQEYSVLRSETQCSAPRPTCLTSAEVTFRGPFHERRTAMREWSATDAAGELDIFDLLPESDEFVRTLPGGGPVYRVDDEIVAVSGSSGYVPTGLSGSHAVTFNIFLLLFLCGGFFKWLRAVRAGRWAGLAWSDKMSPQVMRLRWSEVDSVVFLAGFAGLFTTYILATTGVTAWVITAAICVGVRLLPIAKRVFRRGMQLIRRRRGVGRHAAY